MDVKTKAALIAKNKRVRRIFFAILIILVAALLTWGTLVIIKRRKAKKILEEEKNKIATNQHMGQAPSSSPSKTSTSGFPLQIGSSGPNVTALQKKINKDHPDANLSEDGQFGPKTQAAILKYYGENSYPVTDSVMMKIISGSAPIGFPSPSGSGENDDFPLKIGSYGNLVTAVKQMVNFINPASKLNTSSNKFDQDTYNALITHVGTSYYPVTYEKFLELNRVFNRKKAEA